MISLIFLARPNPMSGHKKVEKFLANRSQGTVSSKFGLQAKTKKWTHWRKRLVVQSIGQRAEPLKVNLIWLKFCGLNIIRTCGKRIWASIFKNDKSEINIVTTTIFAYSALREYFYIMSSPDGVSLRNHVQGTLNFNDVCNMSCFSGKAISRSYSWPHQ